MTCLDLPVSPGSSAKALKSAARSDLKSTLRSSKQRRRSLEKTRNEATEALVPFISSLNSMMEEKESAIVVTETEVVNSAQELTTSTINMLDLPEELQDKILSYIVGEIRPTSSKNTGIGVKNWHYALRHSKAKDHTNLALVTRLWTKLIQQRIYRQLRIKGTRESLEECRNWFQQHPQFVEYVRHVEFWVPLWEKKPHVTIQLTATYTVIDDLFNRTDGMEPLSTNYQMATSNSTIGEMLLLIKGSFPQACVLSIEGGTCVNPPRIKFDHNDGRDSLPQLPQIRTLVLKGASTIIRSPIDFSKISRAIPCIQDWQCIFTTPLPGAYSVMHSVMPMLGSNVTHLHLCMDGFHTNEWMNPDSNQNLQSNEHLCVSLGGLMYQLEALTFSGQVCASLFHAATKGCRQIPGYKPRLRSVDLALKDCCREPGAQYGNGHGVYNWNFICAFEKLVMAATAARSTFTMLDQLRIRYVDLDSPVPHLNPYFHIQDGTVNGIWNEEIVCNLHYAPTPVRPNQLAWPWVLPRDRRPPWIHVSQYKNLGNRL